MARNLTNKKGFTLLELVLYMSIFAVLVTGILYSSFYLQSVMQYNSGEYKIKEDIYRLVTLLQEFGKISTHSEVGTSSLKLLHKYGFAEIRLENSNVYFIFSHPDNSVTQFIELPHTKFEQLNFKRIDRHDTFLTKSILEIEVQRKNSKNKTVTLVDFLVIP